MAIYEVGQRVRILTYDEMIESLIAREICDPAEAPDLMRHNGNEFLGKSGIIIVREAVTDLDVKYYGQYLYTVELCDQHEIQPWYWYDFELDIDINEKLKLLG